MALIANRPSLSDDEIAEIREAALEAITADRLSQKQAAAACGVPEGTFGPWLSAKYLGDNARVAATVQRWLGAREERLAQGPSALQRDPGFISTTSAQRMLWVLDHAQQNGDLVVVAAGPGIGKTTCCRQQVERRPNVVHATMAPSSRGVNTALVAVLEVAGEPEAHGTPQTLSRRLCARLAKGSQTLLIIDEAQHLSQQAVDELRSIHDRIGIGVAFVGDERVLTLFDGQRNAAFAQFFSRIGMRHRQARPLSEDVKALAEAWGLKGRDELAFAGEVARKAGALRGLVKTIKLANMIAAAKDEPRNVSHLRAAYGQLAPEPMS